MPSLPPRLCANGCGTPVQGGRCPRCSRSRAGRRETASSRGYDAHWVRFRAWAISLMVNLGVLPVCGARHPDAPATEDSLCKAAGFLTYQSADGSSLHLDHEPPLEDWERSRTDLVCDILRVQLLCAECHGAKDDPGRRPTHGDPDGIRIARD